LQIFVARILLLEGVSFYLLGTSRFSQGVSFAKETPFQNPFHNPQGVIRRVMAYGQIKHRVVMLYVLTKVKNISISKDI